MRSRKPNPYLGMTLNTREVADILRVEPKTVMEWARSGKLPAFKTLGAHGHWRFLATNVRNALQERMHEQENTRV